MTCLPAAIRSEIVSHHVTIVLHEGQLQLMVCGEGEGRSPSPPPGSRGVLEQQDQEIKQEIKQSNRLPNKFENGASTRAGGARTREQAAPRALQQAGQCGRLAGVQPQGGSVSC